MLNIHQNLLMEKRAVLPGENGAFLDRVLGKGGQGGQEAVLRLDLGCFLGLGVWVLDRGRWTMEKPENSFYAVSEGWYVYGM
jgi:hypothetical protein